MRGNRDNSTEELRRRAEERLREAKQQVTSVTAGATKLQRLVHELEVHQIEMDLQNDELQQARSAYYSFSEIAVLCHNNKHPSNQNHNDDAGDN